MLPLFQLTFVVIIEREAEVVTIEKGKSMKAASDQSPGSAVLWNQAGEDSDGELDLEDPDEVQGDQEASASGECIPPGIHGDNLKQEVVTNTVDGTIVMRGVIIRPVQGGEVLNHLRTIYTSDDKGKYAKLTKKQQKQQIHDILMKNGMKRKVAKPGMKYSMPSDQFDLWMTPEVKEKIVKTELSSFYVMDRSDTYKTLKLKNDENREAYSSKMSKYFAGFAMDGLDEVNL